MNSTLFTYIVIAIILCPIKAQDEPVQEGYSTSVSGMVKLLLLETKLIDNLSSYADELERKLNILRSVVPRLRAESDKAVAQMEDYVSNPLNAFSLIRRMQEDWIDWKVFMKTPVGRSHATFINEHKAQLTSPTDLEEACEAIHRLQDVYNLTIGDMVKGLLNGKQYDTSLNALDSYVLGQHLHKHKNQLKAGEWFAESSKWLMDHTLSTPIGGDSAKMLYLFANALSNYKQYSIALPILDQALMMGNKTDKLLNKRAEIEKLARAEPEISPKPMNITPYSMACRGHFATQSNLHCEYKFKKSPFLRLAPLKKEILHLDPSIVLYHDVLSPREINELQELSRPLLKRNKAYSHGKYVVRKTRTSKGAWLERDLNNLTRRIEGRVADMTELSMQGSEAFNIMNYGLGGHYNVHFDYFDRTLDLEGAGNRIATVLFYLSDVEQGGATVFPNLKQAVSPERGMALFWYNLLDNGTGDTRTLHGGCPVLVGSKWAMTKWIHERAQLFSRPCLKANL